MKRGSTHPGCQLHKKVCQETCSGRETYVGHRLNCSTRLHSAQKVRQNMWCSCLMRPVRWLVPCQSLRSTGCLPACLSRGSRQRQHGCNIPLHWLSLPNGWEPCGLHCHCNSQYQWGLQPRQQMTWEKIVRPAVALPHSHMLIEWLKKISSNSQTLCPAFARLHRSCLFFQK